LLVISKLKLLANKNKGFILWGGFGIILWGGFGIILWDYYVINYVIGLWDYYVLYEEIILCDNFMVFFNTFKILSRILF
jgi:hypothetical protein